MTDDDVIISYVVPEGDDHPAPLYEELIDLEQHQHFRAEEIAVEFLFRVTPKVKAGRQILGSIMLPTVQGILKDLFDQLLGQFFGRPVEFLIILDRDFWLDADRNTRMALLEHELCHVRQELDKHGELRFDLDGNPVFGIVGHDVEEFKYIVAKYGAWNADLVEFFAAARK